MNRKAAKRNIERARDLAENINQTKNTASNNSNIIESNNDSSDHNGTSKTNSVGDEFQNPEFQRAINAFIDKTLEFYKLLKPAQEYQKIIDENASECENGDTHQTRAQRIEQAAQAFRAEIKKFAEQNEFKFSQANQVVELPEQIELETKFPQEFAEFHR